MAVADETPSQPALPDPPAEIWAALRMAPETEVHGGFQSKVYLARGAAGRVIVKLTETDRTDPLLHKRVAVVRRLAESNPAVVGPLLIGAEPVVRIERWNAVCYPYVDGSRPDVGDRRDVEAMAATLATLHGSLAACTETGLPPVAALDKPADRVFGQSQLIHGDYAAANLIAAPSGLKVIDFDECGQGSVEFEIGNTLYMVLFDVWQSDGSRSGDLDRYENFRRWFVDAYRAASSMDIDDAMLDEAIMVRAGALARWLARPAEAPIGIRASSPVWRAQLHSFVAEILSTE